MWNTFDVWVFFFLLLVFGFCFWFLFLFLLGGGEWGLQGRLFFFACACRKHSECCSRNAKATPGWFSLGSHPGAYQPALWLLVASRQWAKSPSSTIFWQRSEKVPQTHIQFESRSGRQPSSPPPPPPFPLLLFSIVSGWWAQGLVLRIKQKLKVHAVQACTH